MVKRMMYMDHSVSYKIRLELGYGCNVDYPTVFIYRTFQSVLPSRKETEGYDVGVVPAAGIDIGL